MHRHDQHIPKPILIGAGLLMAFTIVMAAIGHATGLGVSQLPASAVVSERALRFADNPHGGVDAFDAATGGLIQHFEPGAHGFVRGVLRGFARARKLKQVGPELPFVLTRWADGRLSLSDPSTGHVVALGAFGIENASAFARLMEAQPVASGAPSGPILRGHKVARAGSRP